MLSYLKTTVVDLHPHLKQLRRVIVGDIAKVRLEVRDNLTMAAGVERFTGTDLVKVSDGKIADFEFVPNRRDPQTGKLFQYMRSRLKRMPGEAPPPGSLRGTAPAAQ